MPDSGTNGWRSLTVELAFKQGPIFIVLLLILWGIWQILNYVPIVYQQIHADRVAVETRFQTQLDKIEQTHTDTIKSFGQSIDRRTEAENKLADEIRSLLRKGE